VAGLNPSRWRGEFGLQAQGFPISTMVKRVTPVEVYPLTGKKYCHLAPGFFALPSILKLNAILGRLFSSSRSLPSFFG